MMETQCEAIERPALKASEKRPGAGGVVLPPGGRPKGVQNKVTRSIREAIEQATREVTDSQGRKGLVAWLLERANGGIQDRQIFAGMVQKALPLQVNASVQGGITIHMPWLQQRGIGTQPAQLDVARAQVIDAQEVFAIEQRIDDATLSPVAPAGQAVPTPHPPVEPGPGGQREKGPHPPR